MSISAIRVAPAVALLLSPRQREVVEGILDGLPNRGLAAKLGVSIKTIEAHRAKINLRLGTHSTAEVFRVALGSAEPRERALVSVGARAIDPVVMEALTPREREIVVLVVDGLPNRAIAQQCGISAKTVEAHRASINRKLGTHSTADIVKVALARPAQGPAVAASASAQCRLFIVDGVPSVEIAGRLGCSVELVEAQREAMRREVLAAAHVGAETAATTTATKVPEAA